MPRGVFYRSDDGHHGQTPAPLYELVPPGETWRDQAACSDHPTLPVETWDDSAVDERGKYGPSQRTKRIASAIAVCKTCPVQSECLRDADLEWDEGVRGGVDLRALKKRKRKAS